MLYERKSTLAKFPRMNVGVYSLCNMATYSIGASSLTEVFSWPNDSWQFLHRLKI